MLRKILKLFPYDWSLKLTRSKFQIPNEAFDENFQIKIANDKESLEASYRLLHDSYVAQGLMHPHTSGLRCTIYSLMPENATVVALYKGKTVGTITLIKDSPLGLPSDDNYLEENNRIRQMGGKLIEVSSLAVDKDFRSKGNAVSLLLIKYIFKYADMMKGTHFVITIHPRARLFYDALLMFKQEGKIIEYKLVNGALASYMWMPLQSISHWVKLSAEFNKNHYKKNMALWILNYEDKRLKFPEFKEGQVTTHVFTPDLIKYFFITKTNLIGQLSDIKKKTFFEILNHYYDDKKEMEDFQKFYPNEVIREYRASVNIQSVVEIQNQFYILNILDLSTNGAFLEIPHSIDCKFIKGENIKISFKLLGNVHKVECKIAWIREEFSQEGSRGIGVFFNETLVEIKSELKKFTNYDKKAS